jgi:hypothetical protein
MDLCTGGPVLLFRRHNSSQHRWLICVAMFNSREDWLLIYLLAVLLTAYVLQRWLGKWLWVIKWESNKGVGQPIVTEWIHRTGSFWRSRRFYRQTGTHRVLRNHSFYYVVHRINTFVTILSQINQVHAFLYLFFNIHFNIVLPIASKSSKWL